MQSYPDTVKGDLIFTDAISNHVINNLVWLVQAVMLPASYATS